MFDSENLSACKTFMSGACHSPVKLKINGAIA